MKVLQVLNHFLPRQLAGTEIYVEVLSKGLLNKGLDIKVITPNYGESDNNSYEVEGIYVTQYAEPSKVDRDLKMGFRSADGLHSFKNILISENPDIVHFHELAGSNGISIHHVKAAKELGFKVVFTFHLSKYTCSTGNLLYKEKEFCDGKIHINKCAKCYLHSKSPAIFRFPIYLGGSVLDFLNLNTLKTKTKLGTALGTHFLIKKNQTHFNHLVKYSDKLVTVSEWFKDVLQCNGVSENQIEFIPQALPFFENNFKHLSKEIIREKPIRLLFIGRVSHFKGIHLLIEALSSFESNDFELTIYGSTDDESYENKLKIQSAKMKNVKWMGVLPHSETLATMKKFDIFCLCSTVSEMAPLVIQESFAANLPVLASNVNGNKHLIKNDINGLLFDFNSISSLRHQLNRLLHEEGLVNELKSNISTPMMFDPVVENHLTLYRNLVDEN